MENISIDICKKEIKKNIEDIERSYEVPFSIIFKLQEYQQTKDEYFLEIENESAKEKTLIYKLNTFLQNIKVPIYEFLEDKENANQNLKGVIEKIEDFLIRIDFQFSKYLSSKKIKAIHENKKNEETSEEILEYTNLKEKIKNITTDLILVSTLFGVEISLKKRFENENKKILETMGIFLAIFSIIGLGITGILNIQDNLSTNILLIMGSILIAMTLLFILIKYNSKEKWKFIIPIIVGMVLIITGINLYKPVDKNWEEVKIKIENLEKKLDYEKRINELEKKTK
nr:MAG TPA: hypothetical protein [Caudoviricetes sp.]